ncbi:MAG: TonB-dependent receptor [Amphiplicatus sp.]
MKNDHLVKPSRRALAAALMGGAAAIATGAAPAAAQDESAAPAARQRDEIVVTAQRREQSIVEVPYNISALGGDAIENRRIQDNAELLRNFAGVAIADRGPRNAGQVNSIRIRGLNVDSAILGDFGVFTVPTVSTYVNDTPIYAPLVLKDIERVEVLRGPQGTLYGNGAMGGTIRFIARKPELGTFGGRASASLSHTTGSDGVGWTGDFTVNVPLGDRLAFRGTAARVDLPGIIDYVNIYELDAEGLPLAPNGVTDPAASFVSKEDADTVEQWFGRAALYFEPTDRLNFLATYTRQNNDIGGRRATTPGANGAGEPYGKYENGSVQLEPATSEVDIVSLETNIDLGFATLTSSTSWYEHEGDSISENTGFYAQNNWLANYYYNYPRPMASAARTYHDKSFIQEARLVSDHEGPISYVLGFYYQDQELESTQTSILRGFKRWWDAADLFGDLDFLVTGDIDFDYRQTMDFRELAGFGEITLALSDSLRVTGGVRYFDHDIEFDSFSALPLWTGLFDPATTMNGRDGGEALFKGNISWDVSPNAMLYATYSEGYRRGGVNAVPTSGFFAEPIEFLEYAPDSVQNFEVGVKGALETLRYSLSLYYMDWDDLQLNSATPVWAFFAIVNGQDARSKGLEFELDGHLSEGLHYAFGYAYTDAKLTEDFVNPVGAVVAPDGTPLPASPKHMLSGGFDYTRAIAPNVDLVLRADGYYQSETENSISQSVRFQETLPSFAIFNASATAAFRDSLAVSFWIKNISNARGVTGVFKEEYMGTDPTQNYFGNGAKEQIALPRTFGLSVDYTF